ncbi:MAG: family 78 glycoside hydrolase catalytic domain, partial [Oscillospiraceae bacterium]|nr:family 78 glycoside hydrolase catalytic domain [Oscillospiraceae bacterium]
MLEKQQGWKRWLALVLVTATMGSFFAGVTPAQAQAAPDLEVYGMTTEYMEDPIGLGRQDLVFSWKLRKGEARGVRQDTYRIVVSDKEEAVWDSGVVTSDRASGVPYGGAPLAAGQAYRWRVTLTDNRGASASGEAAFGMGLFAEADWNGAQWISSAGGTSAGGGADPARYTVEVDFTLETGSFGLMLGADTNNFFLYQINAVHNNTHLYIRPHRWASGGASLLGEKNTGIPIEGFLGREHSLRLEIDHGSLTGYLDGALVTYDGQETLTHDSIRELAGVGVRAYYNPSNTDKDALKINKLVLRDSLGRPAYYDDFTGANSLDRGTVEDGQLVIHPTGTGSVEWRVWQRPADSQIYSAQADVQIGACAAGLVLGARDSTHFYMWQINTFDYPVWSAPAAEKLTYLRPHLWNGGPSEYGQDVNVSDIVSKAEVESAPVAFRVDVNNGTLTTYLNGVRVDERTSAQRYDIGTVGVRQAKDVNSTVPETGYFDNILLRDTGGRVVSFDDFEDGVNRYEGSGSSLEDGRLKVSGGGGKEVFLRAGTEPAPQSASRVPLFRKDFATKDKAIARAVVYASALGHYELQLNGGKVGEDYMAPGWTEYDTRVQYQAYDVTAQVAKNAVNSLGAMLAPGWYSGNISILGSRLYGSTQALIANLVIEYADGEKQTVVTDGTWTYSLDGPILETDMFDGESYDATRELGGGKYGWAVPNFDNSAWGTAGVLFDRAFGVKTGASGDNTIALTAQIGPTVKQIRELTPVSIRQVGGKYIVDMGQNFAGILALSLTGHAGQTATIRYGEMLNDGPQGQRGNDNPDGAGSLYTANLRSAKATDRYTFKTDQKETWTPTFTFHGFRYAEISGVSEAPALGDIRGLALASAMEEVGAFDSSGALLNQIYQNVFWGQRSNFLSVPTDCPQRDERMGWGADTHVFAGTGLYNMDASMFYQKWLQDVRDGQAANGGYGDVAPNPHNFMNDIVWNAGGVILPHTIWRMTGDTRVLTDSYTSMQRYMAYRMGMSNIQSCGYGDWLEPVDGSSDKNVVGTAYFAYQLSLMADIAEALGRDAEAAAYRARFAQVNNDFHTRFVAADGTISNGIQSGYVLALGVGLTTPETEPLFVKKLVDRIAADGGLMSVGFVSVNKLMPVLTQYGHSDIAYQLALTTQYPSWGYSIAQGATTIWERWNSYTVANGFGPVSMNSFNHYSFGSVAEWFYSGIAGIRPDPQAPGFQHVIIAPALDGRLTYANARYESVRGEIFSGWTHEEEETYALEVRVPANATATVVLPAAPDVVREGGLSVLDADGAAQGEGIAAVEGGAAETRVSVGSGHYRFTFDWAAPVVRTALQAAVTAAEKAAETEEDHTAESLAALREVLAAAEEVLAAPAATQNEVDAAAEALQTAVAGLERSGHVNLAYQKPVTASSQVTASGNFSPGKLTDGARRGGGDTTWSSNNTLNANHTEWVMIDLGAALTFNRFVIFPRDDDTRPEAGGHGFPNAFSLEVSQDGAQWVSVGDYTQYPFAGTQAQRFRLPEQTARYVRMTGTGLGQVEGQYRMQLAEFEIYHIEEPEEVAEAQWIWDRATDDRNTWTAFRKRFTLALAPTEPVEAQIAVDAKYWLYINGELVVFEGGLKRGPNWNDTYVDRVDIAPYLRAGENTIAVLAWHFGQGDWYSATNSGQAGLYFSAEGGGVRVVSDESWKARRVEAYGLASQQPNYRIPESSLLFDARKELANWQTADYDDGAWAPAATFGPAGAAPWNRLEDRPIPLFAYSDYVTFEETELTKTETQTGNTLREIPADDYVIEAKFRVISVAFGVIFGYQDTNNLNMWQIFGTSGNDVNNGVPWLKPHIKSNGAWSVAGKFNIDSVPHDEMFTHEYTLRLVVENKEVKSYVDGVLIHTGQVTNTRGGFGFRADSGERGSVDSLKITSLDGSEVFYEDHFDGENNFNRGVIEDGRFVWTRTGSDEAVGVKKQRIATYTAQLPTNFQFTPYLRINAPEEGALVRMYTDKLNVGCVMAEYVTKAGTQAYESLGWMNGDKLVFEVPADIEVEALGYRRSGYAATFDGSFTSDDEFLNILWRKARDTLYVTMRDGFMDCPDRERAQWWGDAVNEMQMAFYALSPDAGLLVKKGIGNVLGYVRDGVIPTVAP